MAKSLEPSARGELEITDLNCLYLEQASLRVEQLGRGSAWLDTGTPDSLIQAANFVQTIQARQGLQVACPEEISFRQGWIDVAQLKQAAEPLKCTAYGAYLLALAEEGVAPWSSA
jgi:glucose-1-phosphate thymidylyltransferase